MQLAASEINLIQLQHVAS